MALLKRTVKALALFFTLGVSLCKATEQIAVDHFNYLNNDEAPAIIDPTEAQDLLNVEISHGGKSVKKRQGFGSYKTVTGSQAMHGGHHFFDASGNDVQVWASSTSIFGIVADATATQLISSVTLNTTLDCADSQGAAYCVTSGRNALIKTNGATTTWFTSPLGTMVAITPERLLVAGVAAAPNSIYYSAASDFANFTVGTNPQDSSIEQIASPGSRLTHIEYACGRWLWWKDQSFGYVLGTDQTNLSIVTVSNVIGTRDNSSAIDPNGNVYFRAQDGHIYQYDCTNLTKLTQNISPSIQTSGSRTSNLYIQTSQSDWQSGTIVPTNLLSTTLAPGDVVPSSFSVTETTAADFGQGTLTNMEIFGNSIRLTTATSSGGWTYPSGSQAISIFSPTDNCGVVTDKGGDGNVLENSNGATAITLEIALINAHTSVLIASQTVAWANNSCTWTARTFTVGDSLARLRAKLKFSGGLSTYTSNPFTLTGSSITTYTFSDTDSGTKRIFADGSINQITTHASGGISSVSEGTYLSKAYDASVTPTYASLSYNATISDDSLIPAFVLQHSSSAVGTWSDLGTSTGTSYGNAKQFFRYLSTFTVSGIADATATLNDATILARSSGTYYSPVVNRPNITSWDTFNATYVNNNGTHSFYLRASTSPFTVLNATPTWVAQTPGAVISASTGTYFQFRDDFGVIGSTHNPTLSDVTINWFEGTATDKAYATYFENAIWWGLAYGSGQTTNNYVFRYDLIINGWTLYNIGVGGFLLQNNALYFGSPTTSAIYRFGNSTSDNGTSINAYWKSKDFTGADPWLENSYNQMDVFAQRDPNQTLTVDYGLNASTTTTSFNVSLSSTTNDTIRFKKLLPAGKIGGLFNAKFSDTSATSSWELMGFRVKYETLPYRPTQ